MSDLQVTFIYINIMTIMQCKKDEYVRELLNRYAIKIDKNIDELMFLYQGSVLNQDLKLEEIFKQDIIGQIIVKDFDDEEDIEDKELSKEIICPECGECCTINISDYKITLNKCKNGHNITNIFFNEYYDGQEINVKNIKCNYCQKNKSEIYGKEFYFCLNCEKNICPLCKLKHDKQHVIKNYEKKNYFCNIHGEDLISYCLECKKSLCKICEVEHKKHNYKSLTQIFHDDNLKVLENGINKFKNEINDIKDKFNNIIKDLEIYKKITSDFNNICNENRNYQNSVNYNALNDYSQNIAKDIDSIINEKQFGNKLKYISKIYEKLYSTDEILIRYKIENEDKIRIFGDIFVNNNKQNFKMIIDDKDYELEPFFNLKNNNKTKNNLLEIRLKEINIVKDASYMFSKCTNLISLPDIYKWNTSNITNMESMFDECSSLESLNISNWNTSNVENFKCILNKCNNLKFISGLPNLDTSKVINMQSMFNECSS